MSKRTLALILVLLTITLVLVAKAITPPKPPVPSQPVPGAATPTPIVIPHSVLYFSPNPLVVSSQSGSIDVNIDTGEDNVTGVQMEMSYDPGVLTITNKDLIPGTFIQDPTILRNKVDSTAKTISYALFVPLSDEPKKGIGKVATIEFVLNRNAVEKQTTIVLRPTSLVTASGKETSVLKSATNATIIFQ